MEVFVVILFVLPGWLLGCSTFNNNFVGKIKCWKNLGENKAKESDENLEK